MPLSKTLSVSMKEALNQKRVCYRCGIEKPLKSFRVRETQQRLYITGACNTCICKRQRRSLRVQFLDAFGCKCSCCGEKHPDLLSLEHIRGKIDKISASYYKASFYLYYRAKKEKWDPTKYECLCMSCNWAKGIYGVCPHRSGVSAEETLNRLRCEAALFHGPKRDIKNREHGWFKKGFDPRRIHAKDVPGEGMVQ